MKVSKYRTNVLLSIDKELKMPSEIAKETNIRINHVSKALKELKKEELVECMNEETKKGRLYKTTEKGKEIIKVISKKRNK
ncbi:winged helix-turn-helix domain-containing protein [Methanobrevibacter cuticularis]|uniref:winged helix-turn-helix domain-containing protein n=1 Tax=Methanobrevibacter cuticularis TaxID=47311 RepID=UPI001FDFACD2|nr:winged helix-turn-helix domain-containing protein [Methanobrevibacter cuticularis]